jgi:hypothetical protein
MPENEVKNYFTPRTDPKLFHCSCCGQGIVDGELLGKLNKTRYYYGHPIHVNSGFRCKKHNKKSGGKSTSSHLKGMAADLRCKGSRNRYHLLSSLIAAKFNRIGINDKKGFIHVDIDKEKDPDVIWIYPAKKKNIFRR